MVAKVAAPVKNNTEKAAKTADQNVPKVAKGKVAAVEVKAGSKPVVKSVSKTVSKPPAKTAAKSVKKTIKPNIRARGAVAKPARRKTGDSIAVFIDLDNTNASVTNVLEIVSNMNNKGNVVYGKLYGYTDEKASIFSEIVYENKFDTAGKLRMKMDGVSIVDTRLVLEALTMTEKNRFDNVFVWAGIGDMMPLFSSLKELGVRVLTVDLPEFDCKNKFVDEAIKLFSPYSSVSVRPQRSVDNYVVQPTGAKTSVKPIAQVPKQPLISAMDLVENVPVLPRKKGAPAFGQKLEAEEDEPYTQEVYRDILLDAAAQAFEQYERERDLFKNANDVGELVSMDKPEVFEENITIADEPKLEPEPDAKIDKVVDDDMGSLAPEMNDTVEDEIATIMESLEESQADDIPERDFESVDALGEEQEKKVKYGDSQFGSYDPEESPVVEVKDVIPEEEDISFVGFGDLADVPTEGGK